MKKQKFVCLTQMNSMLTVKGPSGIGYNSLKGHTFEVTDHDDIKFFKKHKKRYKKIGILGKHNVEKHKSADIVMGEFLENLSISDQGKNLLIKTFETKDILKHSMIRSLALPKKLDKKDKEIILKYYESYTEVK